MSEVLAKDEELILVEELAQFVQNLIQISSENQQLNINHSLLAKFINNSNHATLYVIKLQEGYEICQELNLSESIFIIIKPKGKIRRSLSLNSQLNIISVPSSSINSNSTDDSIENLQDLIKLGLSSYFDLITSTDSISNSNSILQTKKKFHELSLSLQHLRQRIHVPDLLLSTHPKILHLINDYDETVLNNLIEDSTFLNELTSIVNNWIREIQSITRLNHDPSDGDSIIDEIQFWKSMESALLSLNSQMNSPQIKTSIEILSKAKRFHITLSFQNDIGLNEKLTQSKLFNSVIRELPIEDLTTIFYEPDVLDKVELAINNIFIHLRMKLKNSSNFPLSRSLQLTELLIIEIVNKLTTILSQFSLMSSPLPTFLEAYTEIESKIFVTIDQNIQLMINTIRELIRKRQEKFIVVKINQDSYDKFKHRLTTLKEFLINHQNLLSIIEIFEHLTSFDQSRMLTDAYNKYILPINALDISISGEKIWNMNEKLYIQISKRCVSFVVSKLNQLLSTCVQFSDFLLVFNKFRFFNVESTNNFLQLVSDEYKLKILSAADREISKIIDLYSQSNSRLSKSVITLDMLNKHVIQTQKQSIVTSIKFNLSLISKCDFYLTSLQRLLGSNWNKYSLGGRIDQKISSFKKTLDPEKVFEEWLNLQSQKVSQLQSETAALKIIQTGNENEYDLIVNFDFSLLQISQDLLELSTLGFTIPVSTLIQYRKINKLYPLIIGLLQHVNILKSVIQSQLVDKEYGVKFSFILEDQKSNVMYTLRSLLQVHWVYLSQAIDLNDLKVKDTASVSENLLEIQSLKTLNKFQDEVYKLYTQTNKLSKFNDSLTKHLLRLKECAYDIATIETIITNIRTEISLLSTSIVVSEELSLYVYKEIENTLLEKCEYQLKLFTAYLQFEEDCSENTEDSRIPPTNSYFGPPLEFSLEINHSIIFQDQTFFVAPEFSATKQKLLDVLNIILDTIESQIPKLNSPKSCNSLKTSLNKSNQLKALTFKILHGIDLLIEQGFEYLNQWKVLQNLWELDLTTLEDLSKLFSVEDPSLEIWQQTFEDIIKLRGIFDNSDSYKSFGNDFLKISYVEVQTRTTLKFDKFQSDFSRIFANYLQSETIDLNNKLIEAKDALSSNLDVHSQISKVVSHLDNYLTFKNKIDAWIEKSTLCKQGQLLLQKQRFKFQTEWLYTEQLDNNISIIISLLSTKGTFIQNNLEILASKTKLEEIRVNDSIQSLVNDWKLNKHLSKSLTPSSAIKTLSNFQSLFCNLASYASQLVNVAMLLDIPITVNQGLESIIKEINEQKSDWATMNTLWEGLERIKQFKWKEVQPRGIRHNLDELLNMSRSFDSNVRQYSIFDDIQGEIKLYLKTFSILSKLKSESMKERHWKTLLDQIGGSNVRYEDMTVGDAWNLNFALNEMIINEVLLQANNEQTIEDNLNSIISQWSKITFEIFNYENKCRLIKNWETLFDQCNADINTLSSMRTSSYFGTFEQKVSDVETKLNKLYVVLDIWIDVQQQWMYLDGVFGNQGNDIQSLLPTESVRFTNISYEFLSTMKRIFKFNIVIDILQIVDIHENFKKILEGLTKVRKSLTEYLEKQRELFPRFYFIGNEDLLEIIGSSTDIARIGKHLKKMFIGIASIDFERESSSITCINSEEGEKVKLEQPVLLIKYPKLHEWLSQLEIEVKLTLANLVVQAVAKYYKLIDDLHSTSLNSFIMEFPAQICTLATQITFTELSERAIEDNSLPELQMKYIHIIEILSKQIHVEKSGIQRKKIEHLIIDCLHQRNILGSLIEAKTEFDVSHLWRIQQLFYLDPLAKDPMQSLKVKQASAEFYYGFEYLGLPEKLAYTPLVDKCFLAMTQALDQKLGGAPFGPAGTGKTETIKSLGNSLGKMVLVFCCDEFFDYQSMGRIFLGLSKVGIWGCFDEFNRLDEKILSAISTQIETIEYGLAHQNSEIEISANSFKVHPETGIFVTMNPNYTGRSDLPENLKKLFRNFSMSKPDIETIVEVLLSSRAFQHARELSSLIVPLFLELERSCTRQSHYDFGLRALKSMLNRCGEIKRESSTLMEESRLFEHLSVLQSINETIRPKLIMDDELILDSLIEKYFLGMECQSFENREFILEVEKYALEHGLEVSERFLNKILQLYHIQKSHYGVVLVGKSGSGKSTIWKLVLSCLSKIDGMDSLTFVIDCKVLSKEQIYGSLDLVTRDWTDGLFTGLLRRVIANLRGELSKRVWIIFDGEIDPEWAENLNSVLDDNRLLTLPNGERLALTPNVRLLFEVDNLRFATPATVTRCGMIWIDLSILSIDSILHSIIHDMRNRIIELGEETISSNNVKMFQNVFTENLSRIIQGKYIQIMFHEAEKYHHIMEFTLIRAMDSFATLLRTYCRRFLIFSISDQEIGSDDQFTYVAKSVLLSIIWALSGDMNSQDREQFARFVASVECFSFLDQINSDSTHIDYDISLPEGNWIHWNSKVEVLDLEPHQVNPNTVVPTIETTRNEMLIYSILNEHKPILLCGPPGSGKSMTLLEALRKSPSLDFISLNFSKETSPNSLMKSLEQFCEYKKCNNGIMLRPRVSGKWVVVFCDEINLPEIDKYGTQRVISLIRQMIEHRGFWDVKRHLWVSLSNIQFVGACNPPEDPGRNILSERFLRHVSLFMVDYPAKNSLKQIYNTYNLAIMKYTPDLRGFTEAITSAMIEVYLETKSNITSNLHNHYIYSPRELTRWSRGLLEAIKASDYLDFSQLIRLWYHEGLRLFHDRLVGEWEINWTKELFKTVITTYFPNLDIESTLKEPILFSNWLSLNYTCVDEKDLTTFVSERLRVFSEEEMEVDLVLHENLLDHALRIDRVLKQAYGHMILVGPCTSGKTTLGKFVAWMNGLKVIQLKVNKNYGIDQFDASLRDILLKCAKGEKICYIIDESSIMETSFIERMNTLLANSEIPGLFEDENLTTLMNLCIEQSQIQGLLLDTQTELFAWFSTQISQNLHVIFNLSDLDNANRPQVISSPALFNRCVLSWMGDWSIDSLTNIASKLIEPIPIDLSSYSIPPTFEKFGNNVLSNIRDVLVDIIVFVHSVQLMPDSKYQKVPKNFLDFISHFIDIFNSKQLELEENQRHVSTGLDKLRETMIQVNELKVELSEKQAELKVKDQAAKVMLNKMLTEQNEAERKQEFSVATQIELEKQEKEIEIQRSKVMRDLKAVEPAVLEAQRGVQNIKKLHLTEIRSMSNPPAAVKMTMESVCILLGYDVSNWREVQLIVRRDDFIPNIVSFDGEEQLTSELRNYMEKTYLSRDEYKFDVVYRASKACGPLVQWVVAQLSYSKILQHVGPLREEVRALEVKTKQTRVQLIAIQQMIEELESSIEKYKDDYSELIRDAEKIKSEMQIVESRVTKSIKLIDNLTTERERWRTSIERFGIQRQRLIGDSIIAAAFIVYCGIYDQKGRLMLDKLIKCKLESAGITYDKALSVVDYLSRGSEILKWENCGLIRDDLNIENFVIMKFSKVPLIIDPSNSIASVIENACKPKKLIITSFLNDGFVKQIENALRFGGTIIIRDTEHYDPLLDTILRGEVQRNGGRSIISLGDKTVDYSQDFRLLLYTLDPKINLSSFVASRTTVVNFSVTSGSLENKVLDLTLRELKPVMEEKRREVMSLNGEYYVRLHNLEEELLSSLSESKGNILSDDNIFVTLESLKAESTQIDCKLSDTLEVMDEVDKTRNEYIDLANHSSLIFNVLQQLNGLSRFYNFALEEFISIFIKTLKSVNNKSDLSLITEELYKEVFATIAPSLSQIHRIAFALVLVMNYNLLNVGQSFKDVFILILSALGEDLTEASVKKVLMDTFSINESQIISTKQEVQKLIQERKGDPTIHILEDLIESLFEDGTLEESAMESFCKLTKNLFSGTGNFTSKYDMAYWVINNENITNNGIIIASPKGIDPTLRIVALAQQANEKLAIVSMGSKEGIEIANKQVETMSVKGGWLLVQNIQMSPEWIKYLDKKLDSLDANPKFRLFLTCNTTSNIPIGLITKSKVLTFETHLGLRTTINETFNSIRKQDFDEAPGVLKHALFLLALYHSIICERMRYHPFSFTKNYDINDSDFEVGVRLIKNLFIANDTSTPNSVNWQLLSYLISQITYGAKVDNEVDLQYFIELGNYLFSLQSFEPNFNLIMNKERQANQVLLMPEGSSTAIYEDWIASLPIDTPLALLNLPEKVDTLLRAKQTKQVANLVSEMK